jgi:predicted transcriptional regulator
MMIAATFSCHDARMPMRGETMIPAAKEHATRKARKKEPSVPMATAASKGARKRERVLVEFSASLLKRTDEAARRMEKNRSELIRTAVEKLLETEEKRKFEIELAAAYTANAAMNQELAEEFAWIDCEGL